MKALLILILFAASALAGRDGVLWTSLDETSRAIWATGWMDGLTTGETIADAAAYKHALDQLGGVSAGEIQHGLDQFYGADYRNLPISMPDAAWLVARYSRTGMDRREVLSEIEALREKSH